MPSTHHFTARDINKLRRATHRIACSVSGARSGWTRGQPGPQDIVGQFAVLKIRSECSLVGYVYRDENTTRGIVRGFGPREGCRKDELPDFMDAIDGDGSPWSYLCASILRRELLDYGVPAQSAWWASHAIVDRPPPGITQRDPHAHGQREGWAPIVTEEENVVVVRFHTVSAAWSDRIYRHTDRFARGGYHAGTELVVLSERMDRSAR